MIDPYQLYTSIKERLRSNGIVDTQAYLAKYWISDFGDLDIFWENRDKSIQLSVTKGKMIWSCREGNKEYKYNKLIPFDGRIPDNLIEDISTLYPCR